MHFPSPGFGALRPEAVPFGSELARSCALGFEVGLEPCSLARDTVLQ